MNKGYVYTITGSFLLSASLIINSYLVKTLNPIMIAFLFFTTVYAGTFFLIFWKEKRSYFRLIKQYWKDGAVIGGFHALGSIFFFRALETLEPSTLAFLMRLSIVFVIIIGLFYFKEKLTKLDIIGGTIAVTGALAINANTGDLGKTGVMIAIVTALFVALHDSFAKKFARRNITLKLVNLRFLFPTVFLLIFSAGTGSFEQVHLETVPLLVLLGIVTSAGFILFYKSLESLEVSKSACIRALDPFVVALYAFFIFQTKPSIQEFIGGSLIVAGVIIIITKSSIRFFLMKMKRKIRRKYFRSP